MRNTSFFPVCINGRCFFFAPSVSGMELYRAEFHQGFEVLQVEVTI